ncbi:MAG: hypothetical protein KGH59_04445 [Candidatus Micrarchaeota archaeon]|nr:hypothetical protein [Candidatus Micrarchaeota archaeon]MDE1805001.1 hypothetical protein [Candidatus Micrarchaeota archaeon]MDE1846778.1 hypothetical protein [Candidatus Micrarchaeota archaeon]
MGETFVVNRIDLRRMLTMLKVSDKNIDQLEANLNRLHRHVNAVAFAGMLQKLGLKQGDITNIFRRMGVDDVSITNIFNALDEQRINETLGKIVVLSVE